MPEQNFLLLQYVICVLVMISDSSMNNLDSHTLSLRIAPSVFFGQPASDTLYGDSASRKVRGSDFCLWVQSSNYYPVIGNTLESSFLQKETLGLHCSGVE